MGGIRAQRKMTRAQTSRRVKGSRVLLYLSGLSYGAASLNWRCWGRMFATAACMKPFKRQRSRQGIKHFSY
jgi:hypothetical protein